MQLGTKTYLTDIILRTLCPGIEKRRVSQRNQLHYLQLSAATNEELWAFIKSIPYFDERLRDFLVPKPADTNIIISQTWETNFIIKVKLWADSHAWLHTDPIFLLGFIRST